MRTRSARITIGIGRIVAAAALAVLAGCIPSAGDARAARSTLVIGIDVSSSLASDGRYESSIDFAANYLYAHLRGLGGLGTPTAIFVGAIGAAPAGAPPTFEARERFDDMSVAQIAAYLRKEYRLRDGVTDFNPFFDGVASLVAREKLALAPLDVVLLTDGHPDSPAPSDAGPGRYAQIDVGPLEYLARSVTVRVLYPAPVVARDWEAQVPRRRVRLVTVGDSTMATWERQHRAGLAPEQQLVLWRWIADHIDRHVRSNGIL